ncbi:uncharacterized protein LAESUDRAFT_715727 [Laetiporus sulphureus 93-53]|uniref:Uncharacterized protein n=1 Tax=Laetiporus sulphureus 93-53 TaxID=1314785 RepID=A0A165D5I0_9APHY|nr:uncharacterized protein LAESUDRAFT_715727 [Laetiporus sulphureus 93-53]KZT04188.1 hypothetical protein LAESUDRAFT_715727 [Laetiporus sulphureus 93-53]
MLTNAAMQHKVLCMYYTNFESKIMLKYSMVTAQFYKMDPVEYKTWRESCTEVAEAEEDEGNGSVNKADSTSNMAGTIFIMVQVADASTIILAPAILMLQAAAGRFIIAHPIAESDFNVVLVQKRSATTAAPHAKKPCMQRGSMEFINIVSGAEDELVTVTKKPHAMHKDKGVPRKKKTHRIAGDENHAPTPSADAAITVTDSPPSFCAALQTAGPMTAFTPLLDV